MTIQIIMMIPNFNSRLWKVPKSVTVSMKLHPDNIRPTAELICHSWPCFDLPLKSAPSAEWQIISVWLSMSNMLILLHGPSHTRQDTDYLQ